MEHHPQDMTAYRNLTHVEIGLMNECNALAERVGELFSKLAAVFLTPILMPVGSASARHIYSRGSWQCDVVYPDPSRFKYG